MIAAVLWALCAQAPPEPPRFAAAVTSVYVDAFVTRAGKPLSGLQAADFELFDNGVKQQVVLVDRAAAQVGAVLVLDTSGSVEGAPLEGLRAAARAFVERLGSGDEMALVSFSHSVQLAAQTTDPAAFARALDGLQAGSATSLYDAIYAGARLPLRAPRRLMVVFTDGADNTSWLAPDDVRTALASSGLLLYVITARDRPASEPHPGKQETATQEILRRLAESSGGRLLEAADPREVRDAFVRVVEELRGAYILGYDPQGVPIQGEHRLEVRARRPGVKVRARSGYTVRPPALKTE